jgi:hypothetical protein
MWLARKLAAEGYLIWCDRLKLLGGQEWPREINKAITDQSFLMLALMSQVSVARENPRGEWTLGLAVAKELQRDFLIPIKVDQFDYKQLGFLHINRQYIDFSESWASGFKDLIKTLDALRAPKPRADGRLVSAKSFVREGIVTEQPEPVISNLVRFSRTPEHVLQFHSSRRLEDKEYGALKSTWAFRSLKKGIFLSIALPPRGSPEVFTTVPSKLSWEQVKLIHQIDSTAFYSEMLRKAASALLMHRGFCLDSDGRSLYLDPEAFEGGWLRYPRLDGSIARMKVAGRRSFRTGKDQRQVVHYNLGFRIEVEQDPVQGWVLIPKLFLRLRNEHGVPLTDANALSRRKKITRDWWNDKQLATHLAFLAALGLAQKAAVEAGLDAGVELDAAPVSFVANKRIDEPRLWTRDEAADSDSDAEAEIDATEEAEEMERLLP